VFVTKNIVISKFVLEKIKRGCSCVFVFFDNISKTRLVKTFLNAPFPQHGSKIMDDLVIFGIESFHLEEGKFSRVG